MLEVIKSYLVSLGFQVDGNSFNQTQQSIKTMDKAVGSFSSGAVKNLAVAGAAVTSFFVAAEVGIAKYVSGLAKADLQNEMFARRMWMSKDNAVAYKNSLSALGAELRDLYLSPELLKKFQELRSQAYEMAPPAEYSEQMKDIRDITFEFQRLKLEATYAMQWIGYYLTKYLEKPIGDIKKSMKKFNDSLSMDMPHWTKQIAQVLSWIVRLGAAGAWGIKGIVNALDELSPKTKIAGSAFLGFFALLKMGPIGWLIAGVTALLLLMDDFKTYQEGGDSLFGKQWEDLENLKSKLDDDGAFKGFQESLDNIATSVGNILGDLTDIGDKVAQGLGFKDFSTMLSTGIMNALHGLEDTLSAIAGALETIDGILSGDTDKMESGLTKLGEGFNNAILGRDTGGHLNKAAELGGTGDVWGMTKEYSKAAGQFLNPIPALKKVTSFLFGEDAANEMFDNDINPFAAHAAGGIMTTPHLGLVAEDGPEVIIPLSINRRQNALKLLAQTSGILGAPITNTSSNTINNIRVTNSPQYKIYGSEPTATAKAVDRTVDYGLLLRNFKGVIN